MEKQEKLYIKGFNSGYLLAKHMPTLSAKLVKNIQPNSDFTEGFISGKEEYDLEHERIQINDIEQMRNRSNIRDKGLDRE